MGWSGKMKVKEMFRTKKKQCIAFIVVCVGVVGLLAYNLIPDSVDVDTVKKSSVRASVTEVGNIAADDAITVYSPVAGKLSDVLYKNYDAVKEGDILVKYDLTSFEENLNTASANKKYYQDGYNAAVEKNNEYKAMLNKATVEGDATKKNYVSLIEARDRLMITQESRNQSAQYNLNRLEAQLASLNAQLQVAEAELESAEGESAINDAKNKVKSLESQISSNRTAIISVDTRNMTMEEYKSYLEILRLLDIVDKAWNENKENENIAKQAVVSNSQLAQYADSIEVAKIQENQASRALDTAKTGLMASCDGTITERLVDTGSFVEAGTPLFIIQPSSGYKAKVMISRFDIGKIAVGQDASITIGDTTYEAKVESISPLAEVDSSNKPKVKVYVSFVDKTVQPTIGLEADVKIYAQEKKDVLTTSDKAVYTDDNGDYVYVLEKGKIARRNITCGARGNGLVEIVEGVNENEKVITSPVTEDDIGTRRIAN